MGLLRAARARALAAALAALPAAAAADAASGLELGLRLGWAAPVGSAAEHVPMSDAVAWLVPLQADALWTFGSGDAPAPGPFGAGAYASWGPARAGTAACADGASCSAQAIRAGAQLLWTFYRWHPGAGAWAGAAAGWEWTSSRRERFGAATTTRWNGPELSIQGGAAWHVWRRLALGPYLGAGIGRYAGLTIETSTESASASIRDRAIHAWFQLGVRGTIDVAL